MFQSQKLVNKWYQPIELLRATAAIYIVFIFWVSMGLNWLGGVDAAAVWVGGGLRSAVAGRGAGCP